MLKKSIVIATLFITGVSFANAQVQAPVQPQTIENPHKSRDAAFRSCKLQADTKQLSSNDRSAFIASCVKNTPR
jgi:hypothetical protein